MMRIEDWGIWTLPKTIDAKISCEDVRSPVRETIKRTLMRQFVESGQWNFDRAIAPCNNGEWRQRSLPFPLPSSSSFFGKLFFFGIVSAFRHFHCLFMSARSFFLSVRKHLRLFIWTSVEWWRNECKRNMSAFSFGIRNRCRPIDLIDIASFHSPPPTCIALRPRPFINHNQRKIDRADRFSFPHCFQTISQKFFFLLVSFVRHIYGHEACSR